ncbi:DUF3089 domain-containing protein [Polymorphobacter sp.]|uniref:DUF3089 domain-containing protein n=1 Tax=Polymorphobacter sp. TaxID=1909290 RepID=UPI003F730771
MLARRFLWVIAILIILVIAGLIGYWLFGVQIMRAALVPSAPFAATGAGPRPDYAEVKSWASHPKRIDDPARWTPEGYSAAPRPAIAIFFVAPTSAFDRDRWNRDIADPKSSEQRDKFLRLQASIFNGIGEIWSPRYRQAVFGAFLSDKPEAAQAIDLAYGDVAAAFDAFIAAQPIDRPLVLAGHSQGSLHLYRLLKEKIAGTPLAARVIAVYAPGWPLSVEADLPALGLPACASEAQTGCLLTWQSFAEPMDFKEIQEVFDKGTGFTGRLRAGTTMLCTNPLSGDTLGRAVSADQNLGSLVPNLDFTGGSLVPRGLGARCLPSGVLSIGEPPAEFSAFILPGNNFHVYDFPMFWANLRADVERRAGAFAEASMAPSEVEAVD